MDLCERIKEVASAKGISINIAGGGWKTANVMRSVYRHSMAKNKAGAAISALIRNRSHL